MMSSNFHHCSVAFKCFQQFDIRCIMANPMAQKVLPMFSKSILTVDLVQRFVIFVIDFSLEEVL